MHDWSVPIKFHGQRVTKLRQANSTDNIHQIMLLGKLGGQADENGKDQRKNLIPSGDPRFFADAKITKPAR